jgi:hypothetical protein
LLETNNSCVFGVEIDKEATHRDVIHAFSARTEGGGERLNGAREGWC